MSQGRWTITAHGLVPAAPYPSSVQARCLLRAAPVLRISWLGLRVAQRNHGYRTNARVSFFFWGGGHKKRNSGGVFAPRKKKFRPEEVRHRHTRGIGVFFNILGALIRASPLRAHDKWGLDNHHCPIFWGQIFFFLRPPKKCATVSNRRQPSNAQPSAAGQPTCGFRDAPPPWAHTPIPVVPSVFRWTGPSPLAPAPCPPGH